MKLNLALNGRILNNEGQSWEDKSLEQLKNEWEADAEGIDHIEVYYVSGGQIVSRDKKYGSVLTAWVDDPRDAVSFQVLEMG